MWQELRRYFQPQPDPAVAERHSQFREVVREYAERMLKIFPDAAESKWIVQCYKSVDAFTRRFPDAAAQEEAVAEMFAAMTETAQEIDFAMNECMNMTPWQLEEAMRYAFGSEEDEISWLEESDPPDDADEEEG